MATNKVLKSLETDILNSSPAKCTSTEITWSHHQLCILTFKLCFQILCNYLQFNHAKDRLFAIKKAPKLIHFQFLKLFINTCFCRRRITVHAGIHMMQLSTIQTRQSVHGNSFCRIATLFADICTQSIH